MAIKTAMRKRGRHTDKRHKLSDNKIKEMREKRAKGTSLEVLAETYNLRYDYISCVCRGMYRANAGGPITSNSNCTLSDKEVLEIRLKRSKGKKPTELALEYDVKPQQIILICTGKSRVNVGGIITNSKDLLLTKKKVKNIKTRRFRKK